jgi:hypothetical protein
LKKQKMISITSQSIRIVPGKNLLASRPKQDMARANTRKMNSIVRANYNSDNRDSLQAKLSSTVSTALIASLSSPLAVEAAITPSLKNTLLSVIAGGVVLGAIAAAVIGVSSFDKVTRK